MNTGTCETNQSNEGDQTHIDGCPGFFEDAFASCLYDLNVSAELPNEPLQFEANISQAGSAAYEVVPSECVSSRPPLPLGSSSDSSALHQRHDSSNSSGSGLLGSDIMVIGERQTTAWNVHEEFAPNRLGTFAQHGTLAAPSQSAGNDENTYQQERTAYTIPLAKRFASSTTTLGLPGSSRVQARLGIGPILEKSRVETQIPVILTLFHLPERVRRMHFPPSSISKSKYLTRPPPPKSADMLELQVALVCTSAMSDSMKRKAALDREAGLPQYMKEACNYEESQSPLDGSEVKSCSQCIRRERKRANRKKVKNVEEEEAWQRDEASRIIVFNTREVIDLDLATAHGMTQTADMSRSIHSLGHCITPLLPTSAEINVAMRITCYCRHHEEKIGFRVIFTIKDYKDNVIAQEITSSIMITDDHKAHSYSVAAPPLGHMNPENGQFPGVGVFPQQPYSQHPSLSIRQIHSAADLDTLRHVLAPFSSPQNPPGASRDQYTFTRAMNTSLSRPVSPSANPGRTQKRRKANGYGNETSSFVKASGQIDNERMRNDSTFVFGDAPSVLTSNVMLPSLDTCNVFPPATIPSSVEAFGGLYHESHTNPSTPLYSERGFFHWSQRSKSMQNVTTGPQVIAIPVSVSSYSRNVGSRKVSRVPSYVAKFSAPPMTGCQSESSTSAPSDDPSSAGSNLEMRPEQTSIKKDFDGRTGESLLTRPQIIRTVPGRGPKCGGIEVTFIGEGFYPGLSIIFGDVLATVSLHHSTTCIVCILPPIAQACTIEVRCNHDYGGFAPEQRVCFEYFDDDEAQIIKLALTLLHHKTTGIIEDAGDIARKMVNLVRDEGMGQIGASYTTGAQVQQATFPGLDLTDVVNTEAMLLRLVDLIDLDISDYQPRFNKRNSNGHSMLHLSASLGFYRLTAALLARGADPDLRDRNGMSSMHLASMNHQVKVLLKLRSVGSDPMLRSLVGYTPLDFASSDEVRNFPISVHGGYLSSGGFASSQSPRRAYSRSNSMGSEERSKPNLPVDASDTSPESHAANLALGIQSIFSPSWSRSSRNNTPTKPSFSTNRSSGYQAGNERVIAAMAAWSVWRDQLTSQVQQLHQTVHRNLPNLATPNFPPMPNLPGYQDIALVRTLLGLVPQINLSSIARDSKDHDYHWWDLLRGSTAPPPYEELYPIDSHTWEAGTTDTCAKKADVVPPSDLRYSEGSIQYSSSVFTSDISNKRMKNPQEQRRSLISAHEMKVKRLRHDRKLFFFWIPLLVLVLIMMLKDRVDQFWSIMLYPFTAGQ